MEIINVALAKFLIQLKNLGGDLTDREIYAYKIGFFDGWNKSCDKTLEVAACSQNENR
jgi:hypothetical protein